MFKYQWYCLAHLEEEKAADEQTFTPFRCCVGDCQEPGIILQERKHYCTVHAPMNVKVRENMDKPTEKTLDDMGRRYDHLQDLREVWESGLYTLSKIKPQYIAKSDEVLKESLITALNLLNRQIDLMSGFETKYYEIRKRVES
jgi:hypothetical protein